MAHADKIARGRVLLAGLAAYVLASFAAAKTFLPGMMLWMADLSAPGPLLFGLPGFIVVRLTLHLLRAGGVLSFGRAGQLPPSSQGLCPTFWRRGDWLWSGRLWSC